MKKLDVKLHEATMYAPGDSIIYHLSPEHGCTDLTLKKRDILRDSLSYSVEYSACSKDCLYVGWLCDVVIIIGVRILGFIPSSVVDLFWFFFFFFW